MRRETVPGSRSSNITKDKLATDINNDINITININININANTNPISVTNSISMTLLSITFFKSVSL